jgi:hypothetical protein
MRCPQGSSSVRHRGRYPQLDYRIAVTPDEICGRLISRYGANKADEIEGGCMPFHSGALRYYAVAGIKLAAP